MKAFIDTSMFETEMEFTNENGEQFQVQEYPGQYDIFKLRDNSYVFVGRVLADAKMSCREIYNAYKSRVDEKIS